MSGSLTLAVLWVMVSLFLCINTVPSIFSVLAENLGKLSASFQVKGMQMDKTVILALFVIFILVVNSYIHRIVPYVSSLPLDMGFLQAVKTFCWEEQEVSEAKDAAADVFGLTAEVMKFLSWQKERRGMLASCNKLNDSLVCCFGQKFECETVDLTLIQDLADAVCVPGSSWYLWGDSSMWPHSHGVLPYLVLLHDTALCRIHWDPQGLLSS